MEFANKKGNPLMLFFLLCTCCASLRAQEKLYSERYADAYKNYLHVTCPIPNGSIRHFVYFARDREWIINHPFLSHSMLSGAQIMYPWRDFEPESGATAQLRLCDNAS